ncbi:MAG: DJ-1/PfpI family protein [Candidatus Omnitrophica bacterium]|nr:DJ-1/PfpI family protein [Candidatus Omnitrophota bacterium]
MAKAVMIIASEGFRDEELFKPKEVLERNSIEVKIASTTLNQAKGVLGGKAKPDILLKDIDLKDFNGVIFIGGVGASQYWDDPVAHKLAKETAASGKVIAAICIGPVILAKAGILKGKRATVWSTDAGQLRFNGANYTGKDVERDGNIITAAGPFAAEQFGEELVKALRGE